MNWTETRDALIGIDATFNLPAEWQPAIDLRSADLSRADLSEADLRGADLSGADLSGAQGMIDPSEWIERTFEVDNLGIIVFKAIGRTSFASPGKWVIEPGEFLTEVVNPIPTFDCGCGVNFATLEWIEENYSASDIWKCRILWRDLPSVVVPYNTDGKARCGRLQLIERYKTEG